MSPFLNGISLTRLIIILLFHSLIISYELVKIFIIFVIDFLTKFLQLFLCTLFVDLVPFLSVFSVELTEILLNTSLEFLYEIWMTLLRIHGTFFELVHYSLADFFLLYLDLSSFYWVLHELLDLFLQQFRCLTYCFKSLTSANIKPCILNIGYMSFINSFHISFT